MKLFPSTLVINGSADDLDKLVLSLGHKQIVNNPDIFDVSEYNIGNIRKIGTFLSQKPYSHQNKIIIIKDADKLNKESQNALLKNLEEPGKDNYFLLVTSRPHSLLPTVSSRCQAIYFENQKTTKETALITPTTTLAKLQLSEKIASDRIGTITYLEDQLYLFQSKLIDQPNSETSRTIKKILKAISLIKANIDPKTVLDWLLLS